MNDKLEAQELKTLVQSVFSLNQDDHHLLFMVDVPDDKLPDNELWRIRRGLAQGWYKELDAVTADLGLESVRLLPTPTYTPRPTGYPFDFIM